jgi:hypothetical protein
MRKSFHNVKLLVHDDVFFGVSLGYDFTSEHEWGTKRMKTKFGIDSSKMGLEGRMITKGEVYTVSENGNYLLTSSKPWRKESDFTLDDLLPMDLKYMDKDVNCAWDESDFCVVLRNPEEFKYLTELEKAFKDKNVAIAYIQSEIPAFSNSSLCLLIADKLPKEITQQMYHVDKRALDLIEYEKEIGITELKERAKKNSGYKGDKYFMACSPSWIDYENEEHREQRKKEMGTKFNIMFWVNYSDDDDNYGWYKAEDIYKWLSTPGLKLKSLNKK